MIYYTEENLIIRSMKTTDIKIIYDTYMAYHWHPRLETYKNYYKEQENKQRYVFVAQMQGKVAGFTTLLALAGDGPFVDRGIPEVVDLAVFYPYLRQGIANKILDVAESTAATLSDTVSLSVGLHDGYGAAQRIYAKRGYIPDGSGVWYKGRQLAQYRDCCNDDDLVLFLSKSLIGIKQA